MLFSEPAFLFVFLPLLLLCYYCAPKPLRNLVLTAASLLFYSVGEWGFLPLMILSIMVNYWVALGLDRLRGSRWAMPLLAAGIASDLALLLYFKYANWAVHNANTLLGFLHVPEIHLPAIVLPLGISFFTFHKISYKVDVYRHEAAVRKSPLDLALYILLFPQLIAGPIIRYHEIADQIVKRTGNLAGFAEGCKRFILGLGKKMIIANTAAACADPIFQLSGSQLTPEVAWLGVVCYTIQIYFDFSGYSDMAIGLGHMFGFKFPENFDHPYISQSVTEFWRRWHISLSRWFRDYLYIPMGGNRGGTLRTYFNLATVFFLCGLWHGASWNFVAWGIYYGAFLIAERAGLGKVLDRLPRLLRHVYTLLVVLGGWALFRATSLSQAAAFVLAMAGRAYGDRAVTPVSLYLDPWLVMALVAGVIGSLPVRAAVAEAVVRWGARTKGQAAGLYQGTVQAASIAGLALTFLLSAMLIAAGTYNPFIYFRF
ncbi:MAG: rane bound O-acyl transferase [Armatimonadetes bacterium]|jgi:alginate O-acetyltransferase complex protein AlgI|nr:rane bound O-acyl transferase [Armatimonadota bacterium]